MRGEVLGDWMASPRSYAELLPVRVGCDHIDHGYGGYSYIGHSCVRYNLTGHGYIGDHNKAERLRVSTSTTHTYMP